MLRRLCSITVIGLVLSACGAGDETRRADAEAIRADLSGMPGVTAAEMSYTSSWGNGQVLRLDLTLRPDVAAPDVFAVVMRYQTGRARSSLSGFFSDLTLYIPRATGPLKLGVASHEPATAETLHAEISRLFALASVDGARVGIGIEPSRISEVDVTLTKGDLDIGTAYRRVAAIPGVRGPAANWTFAAPAAPGGLPILVLQKKAGYPGDELVAAWDRQLAAVRPVLGDGNGVRLADFSDDLLLTTWLPTVSAEADPEVSPAWPAVTGQIRAMHALGRPFAYRLEIPQGGEIVVDSDRCAPDDGVWEAAIRRYCRSLPGNRAPAC